MNLEAGKTARSSSPGISMIQTTGPITKRILLLVILGPGCDVRILLC